MSDKKQSICSVCNEAIKTGKEIKDYVCFRCDLERCFKEREVFYKEQGIDVVPTCTSCSFCIAEGYCSEVSYYCNFRGDAPESPEHWTMMSEEEKNNSKWSSFSDYMNDDSRMMKEELYERWCRCRQVFDYHCCSKYVKGKQ